MVGGYADQGAIGMKLAFAVLMSWRLWSFMMCMVY